jgi:miniconductance mechanosensitive channel
MEMDPTLTGWFESMGLQAEIIVYLNFTVKIIILALIAFSVDFVTKNIFLKVVNQLVSKSKSNWDDIIFKRKVFHKLSHIVPAVIIQYLISYFFEEYTVFINVLSKGLSIYIIYISIQAIVAFLNGLHDIYQTLPVSKDRPIKSYMQIAIIILYFVGIILVMSILLKKEVTYFFTGLGAIAAVLMLVFKDTILGFVGGIQLSANDMVRPGDWIEMPSRQADGDVIDISLHTVKVQNWDKTITTIPTYALVNESFVNWRGMQLSGGRRIKRSINIDMTTVKYCNEEMIEKFRKIKLLRPYIDTKIEELKVYNEKLGLDTEVTVNGRRMTNLGTFRKYIEMYLSNHPKIKQDMTLMVRQLQPSENGLPLEVYVFSNDIVWTNYEALQADIFDHIIAAMDEFELAVFQTPSGQDLRKLKL